jgi:hypothetical protein
MVVVDATMLLLLFRPATRVPPDPSGKPLTAARQRVEFLIQELEKSGTKVIIPTPVLSEILVSAGASASQQIVQEISGQAVFRIEAFDTRAAIELAAMAREDLIRPKAKRDSAATYAKLKFDRQIVAIAKVNQAATIYSDDGDLRALSARAGIKVVRLAELPLPAEAQQTRLPLTPEDED